MNDGNSSTPLPPIASFLHIGKDLFLIVGNLGALGGRDGGLAGERELLNVTTLIPPGAALPSLFRTYSVLPVGWVRLVYWQVFSSWLCLLAGCFSRKGGFLSFFKQQQKKKQPTVFYIYTSAWTGKTNEVSNCKQWLVKNERNCRLIVEHPPTPTLTTTSPSSTPLPISSEAIMDVVCHVSLSADWISASACVNMCVCVCVSDHLIGS